MLQAVTWMAAEQLQFLRRTLDHKLVWDVESTGNFGSLEMTSTPFGRRVNTPNHTTPQTVYAHDPGKEGPHHDTSQVTFPTLVEFSCKPLMVLHMRRPQPCC
jgi:hypothetical protein